MIAIDRNIFNSIVFKCPNVPPETGGIIGIRNNCIEKYKYDFGCQGGIGGKYKPDVHRLNEVLEKWNSEGIEVWGILHTHSKYEDLSKGDRKFIYEFFKINPFILEMYFPIVIPKKRLVLYHARREKSKVIISSEKLVIVKN